jgi:hypothetical protein
LEAHKIWRQANNLAKTRKGKEKQVEGEEGEDEDEDEEQEGGEE